MAATRSLRTWGRGQTRWNHHPDTVQKRSQTASSQRLLRFERTRRSSRLGIAEDVPRASSGSGVFGRSIEQGEKSLQDRGGRRRATRNNKIDRQNFSEPPQHPTAASTTPPIARAISLRHTPLPIEGHGIISLHPAAPDF